ncbi:alcohol dehydrogenase class IV [Sphingomonas vulcanisoli]|uniref:Alcohol dehydrogenase class IV n=1 Tax=Sphingomonas vulcanisoli TaxID=1658060 RepID=A0ABX0TY25_9SPHN|nr:maleylacetate reductase [Sphingomonas vulcanisoli]NIJ09629.1 alcohol dehydrogenase class IV [Sphingomonas vulcanisoli]
MRFIHEALSARVLFGAGTRTELRREADRLAITRALVLTTPEQATMADMVADLLEGACAGRFTGARMHTPIDVTEAALAALRDTRADGVIAIGGGSTTGLAKAIALRTGVPQIILPTTYAGSEVTAVLGETADGRKTTQRMLDVLPETVIYDVELTLGLPVAMSVTSGLNAIAHAAEALYAADVSPIVALIAEEGVRALTTALPRIVETPRNPDARSDALYGAWLCGTTLGLVGMGLHHKLCHVLGGSFDLPHAETHSVLLPYALAFNLEAAPAALAALKRATGWRDPAQGLWAFANRLGVPPSLQAIGMPESGIDQATDLAIQSQYPNPRPVTRDGVRALLHHAWRGDGPAGGGED